jgi:hypothetical protein
MAINISSEVMRAMGFRPFEVGESLSASFVSVTVYEARGIAIQPNAAPEIISGVVGDANYCIGVGAGLNETCQAVGGDNFVEDEGIWAKDKGSSGPFLIIKLGPTKPYTITEGWIKTEESGEATTFDAFSGARMVLASQETMVLPPLVTSLTCRLAESHQHFELRELDRARAGRTADGQILHDIRLEISAHAYGSRGVSPETVSGSLQSAAALAPRLDAKAARFFALGMSEEDDLKRFLFFFLVLEVETHSVFKRTDHAQARRKLIDPASFKIPAAIPLLQRQADEICNLFDRFVWCAACVWTDITEADVDQFKKLKSIRDAIAHGTTSLPPGGSVMLVQQLARKVLRQ